jgi:multidrug efflux pump subunit AcrB
MKIAMTILMIAAVLFFVPIAAIDSVNILFNTEIPFTFKTWIAALVLIGIIYGGPK